MNDEITQRIGRIHAAIGSIVEADLQRLRASVVQTDSARTVRLDFRGGYSDEVLSNQAYTAIHNIANLRDHLRKWAVANSRNKSQVDEAVEDSFALKVVLDLSNNDKHGYPPRDGGLSKVSPRLLDPKRVMRLQTGEAKGSMVMMTIGPGGVPQLRGDGAAKAVVTGEVVDSSNGFIGDLYELAMQAVETWERLLVDFGLATAQQKT